MSLDCTGVCTKRGTKMIGYDTHGPQYPPEWDELRFPLIYHAEFGIGCGGVIEECTRRTGQWTKKVFYCTGCGKDVTSEVLSQYWDSADCDY